MIIGELELSVGEIFEFFRHYTLVILGCNFLLFPLLLGTTNCTNADIYHHKQVQQQ